MTQSNFLNFYFPISFQIHWTPELCAQFCGDFLNVVVREMKEINCPHTVYKFDHERNTTIKYYIHKKKMILAFYLNGIFLQLRINRIIIEERRQTEVFMISNFSMISEDS